MGDESISQDGRFIMALETELTTYKNNLNELKANVANVGKFVLIQGTDLVDVYSSYEDAIKAGYDKFGLRPFLVKQIHCEEQVQSITRVVDVKRRAS